jgi:opacity protein-like surface antigen
MRKMLAACAVVLALSAPAAVAQQEGWTYAYVEGAATATQRDDNGRITATLTCRPPTGDIVIHDYSLARAARRAQSAAVRIGAMQVNVPAAVEGRGRNAALVINLPQRPPILAAVQPTDRLSVTVGNDTHTYLEGGPARMREVAYACWGS